MSGAMERKRMRRAAGALGAAVMLGTVLGLATVAGADTPYQTAWWNQLQAAVPGVSAVTVPAPPTVPADGLYVAGQASQPTAFSGLRYGLDGSAEATLTLKVAPGSTATGAQIDACPIVGNWGAGANQAMSVAPQVDCERLRVAGQTAADGSAITWALPAAFYDAAKYGDDIALVPGGSAPVQVAFQAPDDAAFASRAAADAGTTEPATDLSPAGGDAFSIDAGFDSGALLPTPDIPSSSSAAAPAPRRTAPRVALPVSPVTPIVAGDARRERIMAVALLAALAGVLWWLAGLRERAPKLLGGLSVAEVAVDVPTGRVGGIGRFARPREAPPTRL
jgi:hypothetical protein